MEVTANDMTAITASRFTTGDNLGRPVLIRVTAVLQVVVTVVVSRVTTTSSSSCRSTISASATANSTDNERLQRSRSCCRRGGG